MASSKVMASTSQPNPDLPHQFSIQSLTVTDLQTDQSKNFGPMNMDDLLKNMYNDPETFSDNAVAGDGGFTAVDGGGTGGEVSLLRQGSFTLPKSVGTKTVDEVWKEIVHGNGEGDREPEMTLEDFLTKAGAVREEDVRIPVILTPTGFGVDLMINAAGSAAYAIVAERT